MFSLADLKTGTEVILNFMTIFASLIAGLWVYTTFIIARGTFPGVQFDIESKTTGIHQDRRLIEFLLHIKNVGNSPLIVRNLRFDLRYLTDHDQAKLFSYKAGKMGKLIFPGSLNKDLAQRKVQLGPDEPDTKNHVDIETSKQKLHKEKRGFPVMDRDTFVLPGVDQTYTFATAIPSDIMYVLAWSSFEYGINLNKMHKTILRFSRFLGLTQYKLTHIDNPHTCERVFKIY